MRSSGCHRVVALRIRREPAHVHVIEHALAQRADGLLAHWGSCLVKTERPPRHPRSINVVTALIGYPQPTRAPVRARSRARLMRAFASGKVVVIFGMDRAAG